MRLLRTGLVELIKIAYLDFSSRDASASASCAMTISFNACPALEHPVTNNTIPLPDFLHGGGEIAKQINAYDWNQSSLGPLSAWPQSLRTALSIVLNSKFPTYMAWGTNLIGFFNDAYIPLLGQKKHALGAPFNETWSEAWESVGPIAERALAGQGSFFENLPITVERSGFPEQTFFTFSYSPIRDETGQVGGILCKVIETTGAMIAEKRQKFLLALSDGLRGLSVPDEVTGLACRLLALHLNAVRVGYANVDETANTLDVRQGWNDGTVTTVVGQKLPLNSFGPKVVAELRSGSTVKINDACTDLRTAENAHAYIGLGMRSMLVVPLTRNGKLISLVSIGVREPRHWTDQETALAEDTAERTRSSVERAIAEQALKDRLAQERDHLRNLFHQAPGFMAVLKGPDHVFEFANAAYLRLIGNRPLIGVPVRKALPDAEGQGFFELLDEVYTSGKAFSALEAPLMLQQEPEKPLVQRFVDFVYQPVTEPDGTVSGIFVEGADVTDRKLAHDALRESDKRKDEFLAMLAHELRNPLAPISAAAQLLKLASADQNKVRQASDIIGRQVGHMVELVDDLLDVSRVTRGLVELQKEPLDLKSVIGSAVEQARPLLEMRHHALTTRMASEHICVNGDRTRLVQIVTNILSNAAKYTPQGGEIALKVTAESHCVKIQVTDNGIGIEQSLLPHIFKLFTQAERTPDRSQGGLGIGLALVKTLVALHEGTVQAHSDGAGMGSTITVTLPIVASAVMSRAIQGVRPSVPVAEPLKIMVVDDNADAAQTLAALLETEGHHVSVKVDAQSALDSAANIAPQVYILDIGLPDITGYELARRLQQGPKAARSLFIALTGYSHAHDRALSSACGFDHHFIKPVDMEQLRSALSRAGQN